MSPLDSLRPQLASIMEVLTQSAVAEICALLDGTYSLLRLELSRSRKENELLRRKLRTTALRASTRVQLTGPRPGTDGRRVTATRGKTPPVRFWPQEALTCRISLPACGPVSMVPDQTPERVAPSGLVTTTPAKVIKTESDAESWTPPEELKVEAPLQVKQEVVDLDGASEDQDSPGCLAALRDAADVPTSHRPAVFTGSQQEAPMPEYRSPEVETTWSRCEDDGGQKKLYRCNFCGKTLACLKNLKTHLRVHTGEKPFVCPLCGKRFSDSSNLKRHQSVHTGEKRYSCSHCGKRFAQSGSLKVHMSVHTDCSQFTCSICGKTFISGNHLCRHLATAHRPSS